MSPATGMRVRPARIAVHAALLSYCALAIGPIALVILNAFKTRRAIFADRLGFPDNRTFTTIGFQQVFAKSEFGLYFLNSITVTVVSLGVVGSAIVVALGLEIGDPLIGLAITLVILRITWHSWRTIRAH